MGVAKMTIGTETKFDLTGDTVTPETLAVTATAHNNIGEPITGLLMPVSIDSEFSATSENPVQNKVITEFYNETKITKNSATGAITQTVANNIDYSFTNVTSLTLTGAAVEAHGFVTFAASTPSINISGFTASSGDDITAAVASEVWEFSVYPHSDNSYIIWKNWSA